MEGERHDPAGSRRQLAPRRSSDRPVALGPRGSRTTALTGFLLERHSQQTEIKTFGSAAFGTTTQLLTVSSQIKNPISVGGRILDIFMEIHAITVIATLAGAIGSFLQKRSEEIDDKR